MSSSEALHLVIVANFAESIAFLISELFLLFGVELQQLYILLSVCRERIIIFRDTGSSLNLLLTGDKPTYVVGVICFPDWNRVNLLSTYSGMSEGEKFLG